MDKETYYDQTIAPQLAKIAADCTDHGLSFIAAVQYSPNDYGETRMYAGEICDALKLIQLASMTQGNFDAFILSALKLAAIGEINATNSFYVKILTQPTKGD